MASLAKRRQQQLEQRQRQLAARGVEFTLQGTLSTGPLPPAQQIEEYERLIPGSGQILFDEFQAQGVHRRKMETILVVSDAVRSFFGVVAGLALAGYIVYTGTELLRQGHSIDGFAAIGTAVAIAVGPFLIRNYLQSKERRQQIDALAATKRR